MVERKPVLTAIILVAVLAVIGKIHVPSTEGTVCMDWRLLFFCNN